MANANDELVREIVTRVLARMGGGGSACAGGDGDTLPVEISARHVHLSRKHVDELFGPGYELTPKRPLSQPGQFLSEERVRIVGPAGVFANVAVLGPIRGDTQVELSAGDARTLGVKAPLRLSGDLRDAASLALSVGDRMVYAKGSAIVARNHIHMTSDDARRFRVRDGEEVAVRVTGGRCVTFENVPVRVNDSFGLAMHVDFDEANACMCGTDAVGIILRADSPRPAACAAPAPTAAPALAVAPVVTPAGSGKRLVITAERAKELARGGVARLPKGTIVTPLARDVFAGAGVKVEFAG